MSDVVISGYYGFRNNGDDALLMSIIRGLKAKKPDITITVLSKNPEETRRIYGINAVSRQNVFKIIAELAKAKLLISGGGTLMQDRTSTKSLIYYLAIIRTAVFMRKKVMLYANGIGPLNSKRNRAITARILSRTDKITLRDKMSYDELKKIGVSGPDVEITADPAFVLTPSGEVSRSDKPQICVSVREWKDARADFSEVLARVCDYASEKYGTEIVFLPMQPQKDSALTEKIRAKMKNPSSVMEADYDAERLMARLAGFEMCIGMRLHTLIYSACVCVPLVGLVYDPKVSGFLDYIGSDNYCDVTTLGEEELCRAVDRCFENREENVRRLAEKRDRLRHLAEKNAAAAIELIGEDKGDE